MKGYGVFRRFLPQGFVGLTFSGFLAGLLIFGAVLLSLGYGLK
jgi:hypothetical protein